MEGPPKLIGCLKQFQRFCIGCKLEGLVETQHTSPPYKLHIVLQHISHSLLPYVRFRGPYAAGIAASPDNCNTTAGDGNNQNMFGESSGRNSRVIPKHADSPVRYSGMSAPHPATASTRLQVLPDRQPAFREYRAEGWLYSLLSARSCASCPLRRFSAPPR